MIYYFVKWDGSAVATEDNVRGWFDKRNNPDMFTVKRQAIAEQKRRLKARISELQLVLTELESKK